MTRQEINGRISGVFVASDPISLVSTARDFLEITMEGILGDRHYGYTKLADARTPHYPRGTEIRNNRQVSIVSEEELQVIADRLNIPEVQPEWLGANLMLLGLPQMTFLPPGTRLLFPEGTVLCVESENNPCSKPARVIQSKFPETPGLASAFPKVALHLRGLVAWVERPGLITSGEEIKVKIPEQRIYSVSLP